MPTFIKERFNLDQMKRNIVDSQVWRSMFRHGYEDTPRNRVLMVVDNLWLHLHPTKIRRHAIRIRFTWCMGGITFLLFLYLTITRVFDAPFGMFMRNMHRWAAHAMIIAVWLHMLRVFMTGSYKPPREFNWVIGVLLLTMTLMLSFTGYLLPWDQLSIWAVTVGTNMARATPLLGTEGPFADLVGVTPRFDARSVLLGGTIVGPPTLLRFYVLHCIVIPLVASILMMVHFWRIRKDGGISGPL
jgi:quinol-cytochrome oxidoreductase complex cytochrome b subunit